MKDLISYVSAFDPAFASRIEGATTNEIDQLEGLARRKLPSDYREFASLLGHEDGGLQIGSESSTDIRELIGYYADVQADGNFNDMIPENCVVIAYSGILTPELSLDFSGSDVRVIYSQGHQKLAPCADSLTKLAFRSAFSNFRRQLTLTSLIYEATSDAVSVAFAGGVARQLGFTPEWFSDSVCECHTKGDTLLLFERFRERPLWLRLSSRDEEELAELGGALQQRLGLTLRQRRAEASRAP